MRGLRRHRHSDTYTPDIEKKEIGLEKRGGGEGEKHHDDGQYQ